MEPCLWLSETTAKSHICSETGFVSPIARGGLSDRLSVTALDVDTRQLTFVSLNLIVGLTDPSCTLRSGPCLGASSLTYQLAPSAHRRFTAARSLSTFMRSDLSSGGARGLDCDS